MEKLGDDWCDDEEFIHALKNQDRKAFLKLFDNHGFTIREEITQSLKNRGFSSDLIEEHLDDIFQNTWLTVQRNLPTFTIKDNDPCKITHWIRVISFYHVQTLVREIGKPRISFEEEIADEDEFSTERSQQKLQELFREKIETSPEYLVEFQMDCALLCEAMLALEELDYKILWEWAHGEALKEIARKHDIPLSSIHKVFRNAKAKLRNQMLHLEQKKCKRGQQ